MSASELSTTLVKTLNYQLPIEENITIAGINFKTILYFVSSKNDTINLYFLTDNYNILKEHFKTKIGKTTNEYTFCNNDVSIKAMINKGISFSSEFRNLKTKKSSKDSLILFVDKEICDKFNDKELSTSQMIKDRIITLEKKILFEEQLNILNTTFNTTMYKVQGYNNSIDKLYIISKFDEAYKLIRTKKGRNAFTKELCKRNPSLEKLAKNKIFITHTFKRNGVRILDKKNTFSIFIDNMSCH